MEGIESELDPDLVVKLHVTELEGLVELLREGALVLGIKAGLDIWSHVGQGQPDHVLISALVQGTVALHAVHPVEEVVERGELPVEGSGFSYLG